MPRHLHKEPRLPRGVSPTNARSCATVCAHLAHTHRHARTRTWLSLERNRHRSRHAVTKRHKKSRVLRTAHLETGDICDYCRGRTLTRCSTTLGKNIFVNNTDSRVRTPRVSFLFILQIKKDRRHSWNFFGSNVRRTRIGSVCRFHERIRTPVYTCIRVYVSKLDQARDVS